MEKAKIIKLTPKRAALILLADWLNGTQQSPWYMELDEMNYQLEQWNYKVTEKRRELIIHHVEKIVGPFRDKIANKVSRYTRP
ncbi:hypothetical protein ACFQ3W_03485 [Paenibacillus puldeungensis]|uniref:Uncharacterized protein n=1 Tax=Paenibacillus puldeungensis TaxID=696536 RepID=A0ABW3RTX7_9BACL